MNIPLPEQAASGLGAAHEWWLDPKSDQRAVLVSLRKLAGALQDNFQALSLASPDQFLRDMTALQNLSLEKSSAASVVLTENILAKQLMRFLRQAIGPLLRLTFETHRIRFLADPVSIL